MSGVHPRTMNDLGLSNHLDQQSAASGPRELRAHFVELPDKGFLTCSELTFVIADAQVGRLEAMPPSSDTRATWMDALTSSLLYPRSYSARQLIKRRKHEQEATLSGEILQPLISPERERWLDACAHRLYDLQAWVTREKLQIFTASRTKALSPAPGTYLRREDAVRYCLESGFEIRGRAVAESQASEKNTPTAPAVAEPSSHEERPPAPKVHRKPETNAGSGTVAPSVVAKPSTRLLRPKEAITRTGLSRSSFYERQNPRSHYFDADFPSPVQLGRSAMGYREDELDVWIASRPSRNSELRAQPKAKAHIPYQKNSVEPDDRPLTKSSTDQLADFMGRPHEICPPLPGFPTLPPGPSSEPTRIKSSGPAQALATSEIAKRKPGENWTPEQIEELRALDAKGLSSRQIAEHTDVTSARIRVLLNRSRKAKSSEAHSPPTKQSLFPT